MNWDAIGAIGEILGALAVLVTLIYLAIQVRQNSEQSRLGTIQAVNASNDSAFGPIYIPENSVIFTKGMGSYTELSDHEKVIFDMLMARILGSFIATTYQYEHGAYDETMYRASASYFATLFSSPGCAAWLNSHETRIPGNILENLKNAAR